MGTSVFFGNRRGDGLRLKAGDLERIGVRTFGPVLSGKTSLIQARDEALPGAERVGGETETEGYLRRGKTDL